MKKILKYSTILGTAAIMSYATIGSVSADTGGYVRVKGMESHFHSFGMNQRGCSITSPGGCKFASEAKDVEGASTTADKEARSNELFFGSDDGKGLVVGADYGFFRLEVEGTYQDSDAKTWRGHTATNGVVHQLRIFTNVVVEPFDLFELMGEFGGVEPLVKYNPAHYGISPYAMYGYGVMGGLLENMDYTRTNSATYVGRTNDAVVTGAWAGGATVAANAGAGLNIGLDKLARAFSDNTGASLPEYFKLPIEFQVGYHWQVGLDDLLFDSADEKLGIDDGGLTYSVGLKW